MWRSFYLVTIRVIVIPISLGVGVYVLGKGIHKWAKKKY